MFQNVSSDLYSCMKITDWYIFIFSSWSIFSKLYLIIVGYSLKVGGAPMSFMFRQLGEENQYEKHFLNNRNKYCNEKKKKKKVVLILLRPFVQHQCGTTSLCLLFFFFSFSPFIMKTLLVDKLAFQASDKIITFFFFYRYKIEFRPIMSTPW